MSHVHCCDEVDPATVCPDPTAHEGVSTRPIHHGDSDDFCRQCPHTKAAHAAGCRNCECEQFV
jgi:hypothetical protein